MKAIIWSAYGPPSVLKLGEVPTPEPKADEVRVKVCATTAFPADCEMRRFDMPTPALWLPVRLYFGVLKPRGTKVLGQEFAGVVDKVGSKITRFKVGDRVFGCTGAEFGAYAEYICRKESSGIAHLPDGLSFEQAAPLATGASNAQHYIKKAELTAGEKVLINGAAGCIGSFAVQLAKSFGAYVVAVDSADKLAFLTELGADEVVDYQTQNALSLGPFDFIFDVVGKLPYPACLTKLKPQGRYASANPHLSQVITQGKKPVILSLAEPTADTLAEVANWAVQGIISAKIHKTFDLLTPGEVNAAHSYVESGAKQGHVVLVVK